MIMKRNLFPKILVYAAALLGSLSSCNKYLDVKPEGFVSEEDAYKDITAVNARLNSIYTNMTNNSLYGERMTMSVVEALGQRFALGSRNELYQLSQYNYDVKESQQATEAIWTKGYSTIFNINEFIEGLQKHYQRAGLSEESKDIYKGEALAARAYIHFDLLRLFGPIYAVDSTKIAIAYNKNTQSAIKEWLPAKQIMTEIVADLDSAEQLLAKDPIITNGVMATTELGANNFMRRRNYRLNYYAVKALQARVQLYRKNNTEALAAAKTVIAAADYFPWTTPQNALSEKENPDRVYSTEIIFGIQNSQLYANYDRLYSPALDINTILNTNEARLISWYESNANDYRYAAQWIRPSNGSKTYPTCIKYADIIDKARTYRFTIPLIKLSEVYLIAAEAETNTSAAFNYLNKVRNQRGLTNLPSNAVLATELQKEYRKEFFGEGQVFFCYKRLNLTSIPSGTSGTANRTMNSNTYVVPLPNSETAPRQ